MRTVTFADEAVVDFLNEHYVVVWNNHNADEPASRQPAYSREEMAAYPEGGGGGNLRTYVVDAAGGILLELHGYWSASRFLDEAKFGLELTRDNRERRLRDRHDALDRQARDLAAAHPGEMKKAVKDSKVRREIAAIHLLRDAHAPAALRDIAAALAEAREETLERGVIK
jgi:hypothetical protein